MVKFIVRLRMSLVAFSNYWGHLCHCIASLRTYCCVLHTNSMHINTYTQVYISGTKSPHLPPPPSMQSNGAHMRMVHWVGVLAPRYSMRDAVCFCNASHPSLFIASTDPNSEGPLNVNIEFDIQMFSKAGGYCITLLQYFKQELHISHTVC